MRVSEQFASSEIREFHKNNVNLPFIFNNTIELEFTNDIQNKRINKKTIVKNNRNASLVKIIDYH
jgi:YesN/AraC family two-component response regulator